VGGVVEMLSAGGEEIGEGSCIGTGSLKGNCNSKAGFVKRWGDMEG
jgi:hypothetical protein